MNNRFKSAADRGFALDEVWAKTGLTEARRRILSDIEATPHSGVGNWRKPTPQKDLYAWHRQALEDIKNHLFVDMPKNDEPKCGWFKYRFVKKGPWAPARIWMHQPVDAETGELIGDEVLMCEVNGMARDPEMTWLWLVQNPISEDDFNYLTDDIEWANTNAPNQPRANLGQPVDWSKLAIPTF